MPFTVTFPVRFADVDHADVVYYPKYFEYCHWAFEEFFGAVAAAPYAEVCDGLGVGFPTVQLESHFRVPLKYGNHVHVAVLVREVGKTSVKFRYELRRSGVGEPVTWCDATTVCVDLNTWAPTPIPEELRGPLEAACAGDQAAVAASPPAGEQP